MKRLEELGISPAPWKNPNWQNNSFIFDINNLEVAIVSGDCKDEANANALLISASPKLFAKAWELVTAFDERVMSPGHIEALRAALAEAAGEEVGDGQSS